MKDPQCTETWLFHDVTAAPAGPCGDKQTPQHNVEGELVRKCDVYSRMKKEVIFSLFPPFLSLWDCKPLRSRGTAPYGKSACKTPQHPVLINHFLSVTLPLDESFLCRVIKNQSSLEPPRKRPLSDFSTTLPRTLTALQEGGMRTNSPAWPHLGSFLSHEDSRPSWLTGCQTPCARASPHPHALTFQQLNGGEGGVERGKCMSWTSWKRKILLISWHYWESEKPTHLMGENICTS